MIEKKSLFERIFGGNKEEVKKVDTKPVFVHQPQISELKPRDAELLR